MTNPDNVGTIQLILFFNTIALSGSYYIFQWIYGVDPMTYSMRYYSPDAVQQDTETTPTEFTLTWVNNLFFLKVENENKAFILVNKREDLVVDKQHLHIPEEKLFGPD